MPILHELLVLTCAISVGAYGLDDAAALVQASIRVHMGQQNSDAEQSRGLSLSQAASFAEPGSRVDFDFGRGCSNCTLDWGDKLDLKAKAHLASGLQPGDKMAMSVQMSLQGLGPELPFLHEIFAQPIKIDSVCGLCEGSCTLATEDFSGTLDLTFPTVFRGGSLCTPDRTPVAGVHDIEMMNMPVQIPALPAGSAPLLGLDFKMAMLSADGNERAGASARLASSPRMNAAALAQVAEGSPGTGAGPQHLPGLLGVLQATLGAFASGVEEAASSGSMPSLVQSNSELGAVGVNSAVVKLTVNSLESATGQNFSISGTSCQASGSLGSFECRLPFGQSVNMAASVHMAMSADIGSRMRVSLKPKVSGFLGGMVKQAMKAMGLSTMDLPLCGEPITLNLQGQRVTIPAAECGYYAVNMNMPTRVITMPSLSSFSLGNLPGLVTPLPFSDLSKMPPFRMVVHVQLLHGDGRTIADLELEDGLTG